MALLMRPVEFPTRVAMTGIVWRLTPGKDASGIPWGYSSEVQRAPDSGGSPDVGNAETIQYLNPLPASGGLVVDPRALSSGRWHYRWRHTGPGVDPGAWSSWKSATPALIPKDVFNVSFDKPSIHPILRSEKMSDDNYAVVATASDGLAAAAAVVDSTGSEIRKAFHKVAHTDADNADSVPDGSGKRVVTLNEGIAVAELGQQLAQADSIVMNGDFERGMRYWARAAGAPGSSAVTIETGGNKYSGDKSLKMFCNGSGNLVAKQVDRLSDDSDSTAGNLVHIPADGSGRGWEVHGRVVAGKIGALEVGNMFLEVVQYDASKAVISTITVASSALSTGFIEFGGGVALSSTARFVTFQVRLNAPSGSVTAYLDDVKAWLIMPKLRCKVFNSAAQSIGSGAETLLTWDSENHDIGGFHSTVSNTGRLVPPPMIGPGFGLFLLIAQIQWAAGTTGYRRARIRHADGSGGFTTIGEDVRAPSPTIETTQIVMAYVSRFVYDGAVPDYFDVVVTHTQGANLNVNGGLAASSFALIQLW